jgi:hypothetical protein
MILSIICLALRFGISKGVKFECEYTKYIITEETWILIDKIPDEDDSEEILQNADPGRNDITHEMRLVDEKIKSDLKKLKTKVYVPCDHLIDDVFSIDEKKLYSSFFDDIQRLMTNTIITMMPFGDELALPKHFQISDVVNIKSTEKHRFTLCLKTGGECIEYHFNLMEPINLINSRTFLKYYLYLSIGRVNDSSFKVNEDQPKDQGSKTQELTSDLIHIEEIRSMADGLFSDEYIEKVNRLLEGIDKTIDLLTQVSDNPDGSASAVETRRWIRLLSKALLPDKEFDINWLKKKLIRHMLSIIEIIDEERSDAPSYAFQFIEYEIPKFTCEYTEYHITKHMGYDK